MEILINFRKQTPWVSGRRIERKLKKVLEDLAHQDSELSILFTDDDEISDLNRRYLGRKGATNVLAFPMNEQSDDNLPGGMLGDVVISLDTALRESKEAGEPISTTIDRLLIHGLLHLLGYDHEKSVSDSRRMTAEENRLRSLMKEN